MTTPRGIANNNPGNIEHSSIVWRGMAELQTDPRFVQFEAPEWGFRAMARIIRTHYAQGAQTLRTQVTEWAPPGPIEPGIAENDTEAYIADVAQRCGMSPDAVIVIPDDLFNLLSATCWHEQGQMPYDAKIIQKGIDLEAA